MPGCCGSRDAVARRRELRHREPAGRRCAERSRSTRPRRAAEHERLRRRRRQLEHQVELNRRSSNRSSARRDRHRRGEGLLRTARRPSEVGASTTGGPRHHRKLARLPRRGSRATPARRLSRLPIEHAPGLRRGRPGGEAHDERAVPAWSDLSTLRCDQPDLVVDGGVVRAHVGLHVDRRDPQGEPAEAADEVDAAASRRGRDRLRPARHDAEPAGRIENVFPATKVDRDAARRARATRASPRPLAGQAADVDAVDRVAARRSGRGDPAKADADRRGRCGTIPDAQAIRPRRRSRTVRHARAPDSGIEVGRERSSRRILCRRLARSADDSGDSVTGRESGESRRRKSVANAACRARSRRDRGQESTD